ncbi:HlyD family efflux transporter periplasmic adaptor subunit [Winogradskyella sp.]|uniref:HlyD family secretion protein n=1 Tax=Winogradskyella sp. TaxID=1883156 RepID=UPI002610AADA|nr:HlyD family efflux transporter periplasmic adaptor subunit [Winogradskyella sp.]
MANIIRYPDFVTAKIAVTSEKPAEQIVARTSGALDKIYANNGDTIHQDQILAIIRNTANNEDVYKLKALVDTLRVANTFYFFPIDYTNKLILGDVEPAYLTFTAHFTDFKLLRELKPHLGALSNNRQSLSEVKTRLNSQLQQKEILVQELELEQNDYERHQSLFEKGVISQQEFEAKKRALLQMEKDINAMTISISQLRETMGSATQNLRSTFINKEEDYAQSASNLSQSLIALRKAIMDWEHNYVLKASIDGKIGFQKFWGENQYISTGETVFSILPLDTSKLVGKLVVPSQNAGKISIGQKVLVKLDNFPYQQYGMLVGKVENISVSPDSNGNYFVYISLPDGTKTSYNQTLPFDQELLGNAEIITEDLSIAERIFYKFKDIFKY